MSVYAELVGRSEATNTVRAHVYAYGSSRLADQLSAYLGCHRNLVTASLTENGGDKDAIRFSCSMSVSLQSIDGSETSFRLKPFSLEAYMDSRQVMMKCNCSGCGSFTLSENPADSHSFFHELVSDSANESLLEP